MSVHQSEFSQGRQIVARLRVEHRIPQDYARWILSGNRTEDDRENYRGYVRACSNYNLTASGQIIRGSIGISNAHVGMV